MTSQDWRSVFGIVLWVCLATMTLSSMLDRRNMHRDIDRLHREHIAIQREVLSLRSEVLRCPYHRPPTPASPSPR